MGESRGVRRSLLVFALALLGCGARTELDLPGPPPPPPPPDAGDITATLPCRWSVGVPVDLATARSGFSRLQGGSVGARASLLTRAVVGANVRAVDSFQGAVVSTAGVGRILEPFEGAGATRWLAGEAGFLSWHAERCYLTSYDADAANGRIVETPGTGRADCGFSQTRVDSLELTLPTASGARDVLALTGFEDPDTIAAEPLFTTATDDLVRAEVVHQAGLAPMALAVREDEVFVERAESGRVERVGPFPYRTSVSAAPDRLRGGLLLLRDAPEGWRLDRVANERPLRLDLLLDLNELEPARPVGRLASNETEALVPLSDGSMLYVILSSPRVRLVRMEDTSVVNAMEIVIRPDDSAGGLLYTVGTEAVLTTLRFRPLTCNR